MGVIDKRYHEGHLLAAIFLAFILGHLFTVVSLMVSDPIPQSRQIQTK